MSTAPARPAAPNTATGPATGLDKDASGAAPQAEPPLEAIVIGAGFGGIGMAVALKRAGVERLLLLEKGRDVGGVWRDNTYPGAACDVPSHLYSFSFAPNPDWSHRFASQPEIFAYLRDCARRFDIERHIRFDTSVVEARFDEEHDLWTVTLAGGERLCARIVVSAVGLLGRPALPRIPGSERFNGRAFHSAEWDHGYPLEGKRVAVIGTGASATQFIPAIAGKVAQLAVFQRSPSYLKPRDDRPYPAWRRALFRRLPFLMRLHRGLIYAKYEVRALAFTRLRGLMHFAVGLPFRRMLARQVASPALRARLQPDYPIGCKRILLSDDYLDSLGRPGVELVADAIARITPTGIETAAGRHIDVDAIIYGTGFTATEFLAPMTIRGRGGCELDAAWRQGASAYLGMTVPGFPNFFMLYGPNTNLGHSSIVYMLESQAGHVVRCLRALREAGATAVEVDPAAHERFNAGLHRRLARSVWNGCRSWYLDRHGRNSANWPGFTFTYRWLTRHASLLAYRFTTPLPAQPGSLAVAAHPAPSERLAAGFQRNFLRLCFKPLIGPPLGARAQRLVVTLLSPLMPGVGGVTRARIDVGGLAVDTPAPVGQAAAAGAVLYLHGGAFCLGSPATHRSITTRLARAAGMPVWVPDYRLAPEHPYPAALDDALACYRAMRASGLLPHQIVLAGDSAGAALALAVAIRLRDAGQPPPAGLALVSPVTDPTLRDPCLASKAAQDPMLRAGWVRQGIEWYAAPPGAAAHRPLETGLHGLPPMLVQVGDEEIMLADATRLVAHARACGVAARIEVHRARWHVFHLQAFYLKSAAGAIAWLARFARDCADAAAPGATAPAAPSPAQAAAEVPAP